MSTYSTKTACVIDNGLFAEVATTLAKSFGRVYYWTPWVNAYPKSNDLLVGTGLEGVTRIDSIWPIVNKVDLFVFPDVYHGALQVHLVELGKRVWGSRMGEELELFRDFSKQTIKSVGLPVGDYTLVKGMSNLRAFLKENKNQYIKISRTRGDFETFKHDNYSLSEPKLDEIEHQLGAKKTMMEFIVEAAIDDAVEIGYDGFTIDGRFAPHGISNIEIKDKGYVGHFRPYKEIPLPTQCVNKALEPILAEYEYRGFWSTEIRLTEDHTPYLIDPCCRAGSPPSELMLYWYDNWADIFWYGAEGVVIDPIAKAEWGAQVMLLSAWAEHNWQAIDFPADIRDNVKLHFPMVIDKKYYVTPMGYDLPAIGAICAVGKTLPIAISKVKLLLEKVRGYYLDAQVDCFDIADEQIAKLKEFGFEL